jgi:hypothetical protein
MVVFEIEIVIVIDDDVHEVIVNANDAGAEEE